MKTTSGRKLFFRKASGKLHGRALYRTHRVYGPGGYTGGYTGGYRGHRGSTVQEVTEDTQGLRSRRLQRTQRVYGPGGYTGNTGISLLDS
jgi:hypothetical protein